MFNKATAAAVEGYHAELVLSKDLENINIRPFSPTENVSILDTVTTNIIVIQCQNIWVVASGLGIIMATEVGVIIIENDMGVFGQKVANEHT